MKILGVIDLDWGQQTFFFHKGPDSKYVRLCSRMSLLQLFNSGTLGEEKYLGATEESSVYKLFILTLMAILGNVYDVMAFYI